jgi:hypothetical protein
MGGIHVFQKLIELRLRKGDRMFGVGLFDDVDTTAAASAGASAPPLGGDDAGVPDSEHGHTTNRGNCHSLGAHCSS